MTARPTRSLRQAAALALGGIAVIATAACGAAASAATQAPHQSVAPPVVVNCAMKAQVRPGTITLACADGNVYVSGLHWSAWGSSSALASGTYAFNDCTPNCLSGHGHQFSGLVVLWGVKPLPGNPEVRYFTEMTVIFTGHRSYTAGGKKVTEPQTLTVPLSNFGGA